MNKKIITATICFGVYGTYAQVGIGTLNPNESTQLEVVALNKGVLLPRVALLNTLDTHTVKGAKNGTYENSLLVFNKTNNEAIKPGYYYWVDDRWNRIINQNDLEKIDTNTKNASLQIVNEDLVLTDTEGNKVFMALKDLNVITTLTNNKNGSYTYTSENNTSTIIKVIDDVQEYFQQIVNNPNVKNILESIVRNTQNVVKYDGNNFEYIDGLGNVQTINLPSYIQKNQKTASLINGENTTVVAKVDLLDPNNTTWNVNVPVAKGAEKGNSSTLGVVKEKPDNPAINIGSTGELLLNLETVNNVKIIDDNYTVTLDDVILLGNAINSTINITLPNAQGNKGKRIIIKKEDDNEDTYVNVLGQIKGITQQLYTAIPYSGWEFVSDGQEWKIINKF